MNGLVADAVAHVPGLLRCALVLFPDGLLLGSAGATRQLDLEPMLRAAARCLEPRPEPAIGDRPAAPFVQYAFVLADEVVVVQGGRRDARLALVAACAREPNLAYVLTATRAALEAIEGRVDVAVLGSAA